MAQKRMDRFKLAIKSLKQRHSKFRIEDIAVQPTDPATGLSPETRGAIGELAQKIKTARAAGRPVVCAFGAHTIKNGLGPVLVALAEAGWINHLATNGAGIIHDWEFSFQGQSSEDVAKMVQEGSFGIWQETGFYINLALNLGAYEGKGYGESVGAMILNEVLEIPSAEELRAVVNKCLEEDPEKAAAAADLLWAIQHFKLAPGKLSVAYPWKKFSAQANAYRLGVPFTAHPMIGHDIIYNHPMNHCASLGRCAERDFLTYAEAISRIEGGVYLSIGSAVMSPMIFEKALAMSQNLAIQAGRHIDGHYICVADLAPNTWDWSRGEPPVDNAAYYLRYNKTFSRMGGTMRYVQANNKDFLLGLYQSLNNKA